MPKVLSQYKHEEFEPNLALQIRDQKERRAENGKKLEMQEIWQGAKFSQAPLFIMRNFPPAHCSLLTHCSYCPFEVLLFVPLFDFFPILSL